jgi:hypothetical protein
LTSNIHSAHLKNAEKMLFYVLASTATPHRAWEELQRIRAGHTGSPKWLGRAIVRWSSIPAAFGERLRIGMSAIWIMGWDASIWPCSCFDAAGGVVPEQGKWKRLCNRAQHQAGQTTIMPWLEAGFYVCTSCEPRTIIGLFSDWREFDGPKQKSDTYVLPPCPLDSRASVDVLSLFALGSDLRAYATP